MSLGSWIIENSRRSLKVHQRGIPKTNVPAINTTTVVVRKMEIVVRAFFELKD